MPLAVAARKPSRYPDITEPRACLARIGVHIRGSVHVPPPDIPPAVWKCYGPLYLVTKTLAEHGLIELPEHGRDVFNPAWWRAATRRLPDRTRRVIWKHVHPWAKREWLDGGTAWLQALSHEIFGPVGGDLGEIGQAMVRAREGSDEDWVVVIRWLVDLRNKLAALVEGTNPHGAYPRLDEVVIALDQGLDRIADTMRQEVIRRYLTGAYNPDQEAEIRGVLDADARSGRWADPEGDIERAIA